MDNANIEIFYYKESIDKIVIPDEMNNIPIGSLSGPIEFLLKKNNEELSHIDAAINELGENRQYKKRREILSAEIKTVMGLSEFIEKRLNYSYDEVFKFFLKGLPCYLDEYGIILPVNLMMPGYLRTFSPLIYEGIKLLSCHGEIEVLKIDDEIIGITYHHFSSKPATITFDSGKAVELKASDNDAQPSISIMENAMIKLDPLEIYFDSAKSNFRWMR